MTRARVLTRTVDRHGTPARPTNFHSHTSSSWPNGPFAPSRGCCAVPRSAPALPRDAVHCQRARGSSPRTSWSLRPTLQTSARVLVVRIACERLERGGGQWSRRARHAALTIRARQGRQQDALRCATSARHRAAGRGGESSAQPSVCRGRAARAAFYLATTPRNKEMYAHCSKYGFLPGTHTWHWVWAVMAMSGGQDALAPRGTVSLYADPVTPRSAR